MQCVYVYVSVVYLTAGFGFALCKELHNTDSVHKHKQPNKQIPRHLQRESIIIDRMISCIQVKERTRKETHYARENAENICDCDCCVPVREE